MKLTQGLQIIHKYYDTEVGDTFKLENELVIFMQYTGLKDKNGVEIYEGDLLGHQSRNMKVTGVKGVHEVEWDGNTARFGLPQPLAEFEVIGNIYENPELLK